MFIYSASKAAVLNLTQNVAREFAPHGVRVNCLCPGFFPAEQNRKILDKSRVDSIIRHTPMGRLGDAPELIGADVAAALAVAGSFITGEAIYVDGGFTAMTIMNGCAPIHHSFVISRRLGRSDAPQAGARAVPPVPQGPAAEGHANRRLLADRIHARRVAQRSGQSRRTIRRQRFRRRPVGPLLAKHLLPRRATSAEPKTSQRSPSCSTKSKSPKRARASITWPRLRSSTDRPSSNLGRSGLADENGGKRRVIIEKPFGTDLASARQLNTVVHSVFSEQQVYRIDHYLGKETVQNLLVLRFANTIFEPIWNRNYIDHVQITVAEEVDVGRRGGYYDSAGVIRDMFQNHLLQLLMITAMEAPVRYEADAVRNEKVKVLQAIRPHAAGGRLPRHAPRPIRGLSQRRRRAARTATPPRSPRSSSGSTTGAGKACRSTCAAARRCRAARRKSSCNSSEPPHMLFHGWPQAASRKRIAW